MARGVKNLLSPKSKAKTKRELAKKYKRPALETRDLLSTLYIYIHCRLTAM